ncbi:unnamed protein product [Choristocarpus tenellus]
MARSSEPFLRTQGRCFPFSTNSTEWKDQGDLTFVLSQVADGKLDPSSAAAQLEPLLVSGGAGAEGVGNFARIDHDRNRRTGFPEVVFGEGKSTEQLIRILESMIRNREQDWSEEGGVNAASRYRPPPIVATRVSPDKWSGISKCLSGLLYHPEARIVVYEGKREGVTRTGRKLPNVESIGKIAVLSAGTSDLDVAEEAALLAEVAGAEVLRFHDVGVAGLHRLLRIIPEVKKVGVVVCVAGMDGALPGVVAGLVRCPVVAVPTSVGYGAAMGGIGPLLTMLNACAPGVAVVNIDNGFGAAAFAVKTLNGAGVGD